MMAQEVFKIGKTKSNMVTIAQPLGDMGVEHETTYTEDSGRVKTGDAVVKPLFTVYQYQLAFENLTKAQMKQITNIVKTGKKFWMHFFSVADAEWVTKQFYCGKFSSPIATLKNGNERFDMSFNVEGVKPL